jgi:hypothetical protein
MINIKPDEVLVLLSRIRRRRHNIRVFVDHLQPAGRLLTNVNIVFGVLATVLTVTPAIGGKALLGVIGESNPDSPAWRWLFGLAAFFSLLSTIAAKLYKSRDIAARLAAAQTGNAKLAGLETLLELEQLPVRKAVEEYNRVNSEISFVSEYQVASSKNVIELAKGEIQIPIQNQSVNSVIRCSGWAEDIRPGCHLWLAVEIKGRIWPKEREIFVDEKGVWECTISEEGEEVKFSLSLFAVNDAANRKIRAWLDKGDARGDYVELRRLAGMRRLARVDGLHK